MMGILGDIGKLIPRIPFGVLCLFNTRAIADLQNFLSSVVLNNICFLTISSTSCYAIHLHMRVKQMTRCFNLGFTLVSTKFCKNGRIYRIRIIRVPEKFKHSVSDSIYPSISFYFLCCSIVLSASL